MLAALHCAPNELFRWCIVFAYAEPTRRHEERRGRGGGDFMDTIDTQSLRAHKIIGFDESTIFALRCGSCCRCCCRCRCSAHSFLSNCYYQSIFYLHLNFHLAKFARASTASGEKSARRDVNLCVLGRPRAADTYTARRIMPGPIVRREPRSEGGAFGDRAGARIRDKHRPFATTDAFPFDLALRRCSALSIVVIRSNTVQAIAQKIHSPMGNHSAKWRDVGAFVHRSQWIRSNV